jgi:hypothetical protein
VAVDAGPAVVLPAADSNTHSVRVRIDLPAGIQAAYPGLYGRVRFATAAKSRLLVPQVAVVQRSEVTGVYVVGVPAQGQGQNQSPVRFRQVRLGEVLGGGRVEVLAGLRAGEQVATEPVKAGIYLRGRP